MIEDHRTDQVEQEADTKGSSGRQDQAGKRRLAAGRQAAHCGVKRTSLSGEGCTSGVL